MSAPLRWIMNGVAGAAVAGGLTLGGAWFADQSRRWDPPQWPNGAFVPLREAVTAASDPRSRWVMAVNPACGHCMETLAHTQAAWTKRGWQPELEALIVDTPERPGPEALRSIPTPRVWWDARGSWRRRWGHRVYGELLQFDGAGRHVRTLTAQDVLGRPHLPTPDLASPRAPAPRKGDTR